MKSKKPKRRYYTANQIREEIDKYHAKIMKLEDLAKDYDRRAEELIALDDPLQSEAIGFNRTRAEQVRRSVERILMKRLPHLAQKLAEFSTDVLPNCGIEDRSVQA